MGGKVICRNRRCEEYYRPEFEGGGITGLCPSCRAAGRWGVAAAFVAMLGWKLVCWWLGV
jgi:hypothetical protein